MPERIVTNHCPLCEDYATRAALAETELEAYKQDAERFRKLARWCEFWQQSANVLELAPCGIAIDSIVAAGYVDTLEDYADTLPDTEETP